MAAKRKDLFLSQFIAAQQYSREVTPIGELRKPCIKNLSTFQKGVKK